MTQPNVDPRSIQEQSLHFVVPLGGGSKSADITPEVEMFHLLLPLIQAATGNNLAHLYK